MQLVVEVQIAVPPAVALAAVKQLCSSSSSSSNNKGSDSFFAALNAVQCDAVSGPAGEVRSVTCATCNFHAIVSAIP
jgi:hypothetical protein